MESTCGLAAGETLWAVLGFSEDPASWNPDRAESLFESTIDYWSQWSASLRFPTRHLPSFKRAAITIHLLGYAPAGSVVAAPTTSLPERLGGERNFDYRFAWVRDASLSLALLALFGKADEVRPYMDWLSGLGSSSEGPLQVLYGIKGGKELKQTELPGIPGYGDSRPVRFGTMPTDSFRTIRSATWPIAALGQFECAFFPTTFWLATTYAKAGRPERAEAILAGCEELVGDLGLFAEGVDAKTGAFRGNTPLLFSQVEYVRARMDVA